MGPPQRPTIFIRRRSTLLVVSYFLFEFGVRLPEGGGHRAVSHPAKTSDGLRLLVTRTGFVKVVQIFVLRRSIVICNSQSAQKLRVGLVTIKGIFELSQGRARLQRQLLVFKLYKILELKFMLAY